MDASEYFLHVKVHPDEPASHCVTHRDAHTRSLSESLSELFLKLHDEYKEVAFVALDVSKLR